MIWLQITVLTICFIFIFISVIGLGYEACKYWSKKDADIRIVTIAPLILLAILITVFILSNTSKGYQATVSMMIQISGITLGLVAAIIAFRNYRRKSGAQISYVMC